MEIIIYHSSDEHGSYLPLAEFAEANGRPDLWVLSGDFFPNLTRGISKIEEPYQTGFFDASLVILKRAFGKTPILLQQGNHDYADLLSLLHKNLFDAYEALDTRQAITIKGCRITYAGFRDIPFIAGEWKCESQPDRIQSVVQRVMQANPDLLINHAPPGGIMDGTGNIEYGQAGYGMPQLSSKLFYEPHDIRGVFFGHSHWCAENPRIVKKVGGKGQEMIFSNAAQTVQKIVMDF